MSNGSRRGPAAGGPRPVSGRRRAAVAVEPLEGRSLLSHIGGHHLAPAVAEVQGAAFHGLSGDSSVRRFNQPGPLKDSFGPGFAIKVPRFYGYYTGPIGFPTATSTPKGSTTAPPSGNPLNGYLNAAGAKAYIVGNTLQLTGIIAGFIQATPGPGQEAFYNFGINRGGASAPGPIFQRDRITFDSVVTVGITQKGVGATVTLLNPSTLATVKTIHLKASSVTTNFDAVKVTVPLNDLPSTGAAPSQYRVNFFPTDAAPPKTFNDIASFLPEDNTFPVAVLRGR